MEFLFFFEFGGAKIFLGASAVGFREGNQTCRGQKRLADRVEGLGLGFGVWGLGFRV